VVLVLAAEASAGRGPAAAALAEAALEAGHRVAPAAAIVQRTSVRPRPPSGSAAGRKPRNRNIAQRPDHERSDGRIYAVDDLRTATLDFDDIATKAKEDKDAADAAEALETDATIDQTTDDDE
jgi:hypothetical protein